MRPTWVSPAAAGLLLVLALAAPLHAQSSPVLRGGGRAVPEGPGAHRPTSRTGSTPSSRPRFRSCARSKDELDAQEAELSRLIEAGADEALVIRQVDKVEAIRAELNKTRTLMLLHKRQVLTPEQRVKLNKLARTVGPRTTERPQRSADDRSK